MVQTMVVLLAVMLCGEPESPAADHVKKGKAFLSAGKYREAAAEFEEALKTDPLNTPALFSLGDIHANYLKDAKLRDKYWRQYKAASLISLGDVASAGGDFREAAAHYRGALKLMPGYGKLHERLGAVCRRMGNEAEALKEYRAAADLEKENIQLQLGIARYLAGHGDRRGATVYAERAVAARPNDAALKQAAVGILAETGKAVGTPGPPVATQKPVAISAEEHCARGERALEEGRLGEAAREIRKGISGPTREQCAQSARRLAEAFARKGSMDGAVAVYKALLSAGIRSADVYNSLAILYQEMGKLDDAVGTARAGVDLYPAVAELHNNLGTLYALRAEYERALSEYRKAVELKPDLAEAYLDMGIIYKDYLKDKEKAVEAFRSYAALKPEGTNVPEVAELLGGGKGPAGSVPGRDAKPQGLIGTDEHIAKPRRVLRNPKVAH
ncbi:MAG: tetratricopeptide repeat protein [Candidatus Aureabacteria bacterium]|nr:tetratricopeptide repeat protein [Candidatus Auribacterota bacterium]